MNFQAQFADDVEAGRKTGSIRAPRKDGRDPRPGDLLQLYTGMRTKTCRLLGEVICLRVRPVSIDYVCIILDGKELYGGDGPAYIGGPDPEQYDNDFARADGFRGFGHMVDWFVATHGPLPFKGLLIQWSQPT